jgi:hypothetical protein
MAYEDHQITVVVRFGLSLERSLYIAGCEFIAIKKPFAEAICIAVDTHQATVARHAEHLDNRPDPANQIGNGPLPLPNAYSISAAKISLLGSWCHLTHRLSLSDCLAELGHNMMALLNCPRQAR